jgi:ATP-dependent DNA helicase RecQ
MPAGIRCKPMFFLEVPPTVAFRAKGRLCWARQTEPLTFGAPMADIHSILQAHWGYTSFRPLQQEIIESVLSGKDTLAVLPTGGGKSICFQVPAMAQPGICLVVSPLIALMKDQVENLKRRSIPALLIHSGMQRADVVQTLKNATHSYFKFLYVSPERLETSLFREYLPAMDINLIAVDEAHCISQWGYEFRPSYLRIAELRKDLPRIPVLALTASATDAVQKDICEKLTPAPGPVRQKKESQPSWALFKQSFGRPNLSYSVFQVDSKLARLVEIIKKVPGTVIVYCKSRKRTNELAQLMQMHGISATSYHAGLTNEERNKRQQQWINNGVRVMACTNAFGMGIDKPDVRLVVHVDSPDCLENYYQEAGRAGRDGKKAYAVLLFDHRDRDELLQLHHSRYPSLDFIRQVYGALVNFLQIPVYNGQDKSYLFRFENFVQNFKLPPVETLHALKALEQDGWFDFNDRNFASSMLVFATSKNGLYEFYKAHPQHESILTTLLRSYEGIFDFPVFISETLLAKLLKKEEGDIKQQLQTIASFGLIHYTPRNDEPQIIFRKNRVKAEELSFDLMSYYKRRDIFKERVQKITDYLTVTGCRSQFISHYFGEEAPPACGVCDNCLKVKATTLSQEEFEQISQVITQKLQAGTLGIDGLLNELSGIKKEKLWKVIQFLQAEGKLFVDQNNKLGFK